MLDVRSAEWHGDFERLRDAMRDLDQLLVNAWNMAFEGASTLTQHLELTRCYVGLAKR